MSLEAKANRAPVLEDFRTHKSLGTVLFLARLRVDNLMDERSAAYLA